LTGFGVYRSRDSLVSMPQGSTLEVLETYLSESMPVIAEVNQPTDLVNVILYCTVNKDTLEHSTHVIRCRRWLFSTLELNQLFFSSSGLNTFIRFVKGSRVRTWNGLRVQHSTSTDVGSQKASVTSPVDASSATPTTKWRKSTPDNGQEWSSCSPN